MGKRNSKTSGTKSTPAATKKAKATTSKKVISNTKTKATMGLSDKHKKSNDKGKRKFPNHAEDSTSLGNKKAKVSSNNDQVSKPSSKDQKTKEMDGKILKVMLEFSMEKRYDVSVTDVANELGVQERTKSFRSRWGFLKKNHYIEAFGNGGHRLTKKGLEEAATPEYKEMMKELSIKPKTNKEHQERIKKYLKQPKSTAMFDFFLEYGSLTNAELSALMGVNHRSHQYHYSLQELRKKNLVEVDANSKSNKAKKFRLSDKAFLNAKEDRIKMECIDTKKLATEIAIGLAQIDSRKRGRNSKVKKDIAVKAEGVVKEETDDSHSTEVKSVKDGKNECKIKILETKNKREVDIYDDDDDSLDVNGKSKNKYSTQKTGCITGESDDTAPAMTDVSSIRSDTSTNDSEKEE